MLLNDALLRTRRLCAAVAHFWSPMERLWTVLVPFWLSTDEISMTLGFVRLRINCVCFLCFFLQVIGDENRRKEYDMMGQAGFGGGAGMGGAGGFQGQWQQTSMDPEELFRKIFGNQAFDRGGMFDESMFGGFNRAHEVQWSTHPVICVLCRICEFSYLCYVLFKVK